MNSVSGVIVTGAGGFLGWHTCCRLRAMHGLNPVRVGRDEFMDPRKMDRALASAGTVLHIAGVNRAQSDHEVEAGNVGLATQLAEAIERGKRPIRVVFANSVQSHHDNAYGRGKREAARRLAQAVASVGGNFTDVLLPNLFGEHGRPSYNSFVATFAHEVSRGRAPIVQSDRAIPLLHAQDAADALIEAGFGAHQGELAPAGEPHLISDVLRRLEGFHESYRLAGELPDLTERFDVDLFNTYRSYTFPDQFPIYPQVHADARGVLFETVRSHGGTGQAFVSTTVPGATRGNHYHLRKVERFFVVKGEAEIRLRRLWHGEVVSFRLSGERPAFVDMPTMWVHSIRNIGNSELVTMFWADQLLDPVRPDQYAEMVEVEESMS